MITGTYKVVVDPQWRNVQQQEVFLECDTKDGEVYIDLFEISELNRFWNVKFIISDGGNNASVNNIFINASGIDSIDQNGTIQVVLNVNGESVTFQPVSEVSWIALESVGGAAAIPTLQEVLDNNHDLVDGNNFQGTGAGQNNQGTNVSAFGEDSARANIGKDVNAFGFNSADSNEGDGVNAFGNGAGRNNTGNNVNLFGQDSGLGNIGAECNFFGSQAGIENQQFNVHGFGTNAGRNNSGRHAVFIGAQAGYDVATDTGNSIASVFVINNAVLPSFPDSATAQAALTVLNGAVAGNTYLFYQADKGVIGAIRL